MKLKYSVLATILLLPIPSISEEKVTYEALCNDTANVIRVLTEKYNERPVLIGEAVDVANSVMTLWANKKTKTWTIVATKGDISCLIGAGGNLELVPSKSESKIKS